LTSKTRKAGRAQDKSQNRLFKQRADLFIVMGGQNWLRLLCPETLKYTGNEATKCMKKVNESVAVSHALCRVSSKLLDLLLSDSLDLRGALATLTGFSARAYEDLQQALQAPDFSWRADQLLMMTQAINNLNGYPHGQHDWLAAAHDIEANTLIALYNDFYAAYQMITGYIAERY
jgi:hypothetical protein